MEQEKCMDNCPHCGFDLNGELIYEYFLKTPEWIPLERLNAMPLEEAALETAKMYGATKTEGRWRNDIAIYDIAEDKTVEYECPECLGRWPR
jgi:hypothetical protein